MILNRVNRRKTTKARRTQVINVPLILINDKLNALQEVQAKSLLKEHSQSYIANNIEKYSKFFTLNKSAFAGKRKFIFHATPKR